MDAGASPCGGAGWIALSQRSDGWGVGVDSTVKRGGRRREIDVREVLNAILYVLSSGCQWKALPKGLPPKSTVHFYFILWDWDGMLVRIHHALYIETREREGRETSPSAAIIHSQSAKAAQKGARASIRRASTRARRSPAASSTSSSTRSVCC